MTFLEIIEQIQRIDHLIRLKATGPPASLATRLNLSERAVYDRIKMMRGLGAPIEYSSTRQSYFYRSDVQFKFGFLNGENSIERISGGSNYKIY